ncbi:MAG: serine/threonine protein phosphatase [Cytophagales bacterium]|nr:serine/threonine protein phosphatase [Armatimonadota bacterium]
MRRILVIGDIHGCSTALETLLAFVAPLPTDTLVTLGDYVDRGPDTCGVLERLITLSKTHHLVALRGNHELMLLDARDDRRISLAEWRKFGGDATLDSYQGSLDGIPDTHWSFIEQQCVDCWETETHFFVHANAYPDLPLYEQPRYTLYWCKFGNPAPHESGKIMVCGHTSQKNGLPLNFGHAVCIDTWACGDGWLSCLDIYSGLVYQANQARETRRLRLGDLLVPTEE